MRPFAGGLLLIAAGTELLLIPLSGVFLHGAAGLDGFGGVAGSYSVQVAVLETTCGIVVWTKPKHRASFGFIGVVLAIVSFVTSTLGGFFAGMLLGITGGSLAFAWTPARPDPDPDQPVPGRHRASSRIPVIALAGALLIPPPTGRAEQLSTVTAAITARKATLSGVAYQGVDTIGTRRVMKFTLSSLTLSDFTVPLDDDRALVLHGSSAEFSGGVTLYAPQASADLLGSRLTLVPGNAALELLHLLRPLTPLISITLTNLGTGQILMEAGNLRVTGATIRPAHG
jgi:uncharacterized protein DUF6114